VALAWERDDEEVLRRHGCAPAGNVWNLCRS
jgi:hypothetical protein